MSQNSSSPGPGVLFAFAAMCLVWGSTWMMIKIGLQGAPPLTTLGLRFLLAGIAVGVIIRASGLSLPAEARFWRYTIFLGFSHLAIPYSLVYWGEQHISSGLTAIVYTTMPLMVALIARVWLGNPLGVARITGIIVGMAGVALIFSDSLSIGGAHAAAGLTAILLSVFFASVSSVAVKKFGHHYHPLVALLYPFLIASVLVLGGAAAFERVNPLTLSAATWGTIAYLALLGSVLGFTLLFWVIRRMDVTVTSYQTFIIPVVAVIFGGVFLGERIPARTGAGAAIILVGIALSTVVPARIAQRRAQRA